MSNMMDSLKSREANRSVELMEHNMKTHSVSETEDTFNCTRINGTFHSCGHFSPSPPISN